jgi:hypothetical protein
MACTSNPDLRIARTRGKGVGGEGGLFQAEDTPPHSNPSPPSTGARGF